MIFILIASLVWGLWISIFVLSPLFQTNKKMLFDNSKFKSVENTLHRLREIKKHLCLKLVQGHCEDIGINSLSEAEAFEKLYDVWEDLHLRGEDLSSVDAADMSSRGSTAGSTHLLYVIILCFITALISNKIYAQTKLTTSAPREVVLPGPTVLPESGYWVPSVNQFILTPDQGILHVYYVGMFSNTFHAKSTKIILPFPKNISDVSIKAHKAAMLEKSQNTNSDFILNTPLENEINEIQGEFSLSAENGVALFEKNSLATLPGVTLIIMPEYQGLMREFFSRFNDKINLWPARVINISPEFKYKISNQPLNSTGEAAQLSRQFVRVSADSAPFPEFKVVGLVPSRFFIYLLVIFFSCFFIAAVVLRLIKFN